MLQQALTSGQNSGCPAVSRHFVSSGPPQPLPTPITTNRSLSYPSLIPDPGSDGVRPGPHQRAVPRRREPGLAEMRVRSGTAEGPVPVRLECSVRPRPPHRHATDPLGPAGSAIHTTAARAGSRGPLGPPGSRSSPSAPHPDHCLATAVGREGEFGALAESVASTPPAPAPAPEMHWKGGGTPTPPYRAPSLCPATVSLTASARLNAICNRQ